MSYVSDSNIYCQYYNKIYKECEHTEKQKEENGECLLILYGECEVVDDER